MLVESAGARGYLLGALEGAPDLFDHLLHGLTMAEADFRPDPERFTIREIMAHLADWDAVFLQRLRRTCDEICPTLEELDEGQRASAYAHTDVGEQSRLFRERRAQTVEFVRTLSPQQWQRECLHPRVGPLTLEGLVTLMPLHDAYHLRQLVEWRRSYSVF